MPRIKFSYDERYPDYDAVLVESDEDAIVNGFDFSIEVSQETLDRWNAVGEAYTRVQCEMIELDDQREKLFKEFEAKEARRELDRTRKEKSRLKKERKAKNA